MWISVDFLHSHGKIQQKTEADKPPANLEVWCHAQGLSSSVQLTDWDMGQKFQSQVRVGRKEKQAGETGRTRRKSSGGEL